MAVLATIIGCADTITFSQDAEREGMKLYNQHKYADAAGAFRNAVRQNPRHYVAEYYLGASLDELGEYQEALQAYKAALDVMSTSLEGKLDAPFREKIIDALAYDISRSANSDKEIQLLKTRAEAQKSSEAYLVLARVYRNMGDPDSAIKAYELGTNIDPNNFYLQKEYGLYLSHLGLRQKAMEPLKKAHDINSQDDQVNNALK